ncbi:alginate export family protein [bacterium]|nr:alginate export family protein [bacterium]
MDGQIQVRGEYRDFGLAAYTKASTNQGLQRSRLGLGAKLPQDAAFYFQFQDAREWGGEASTASNEQNVDMKQGYFSISNALGGPWDLKVGRQVLAFGEQKLIGGFEWDNVARSFDGLSFVRKDFFGWNAHAFATKVVSAAANTDNEQNFYGLYLSSVRMKTNLYAFFKRDGRANYGSGAAGDTGILKSWTLGGRASGDVPRSPLTYDAELNVQRGDHGKLDLDAWAAMGRLTYALKRVPRLNALSVEYNLGSGDKSPTDRKVNTFDNLFPTNHLHYGYADLFSWSNLENWRFRAAGSARLFGPATWSADYHLFKRHKNTDAWYRANGSAVRAASTTAGDRIGDEIDFVLKLRPTEIWSVETGWSLFDPGALVRNTGVSPSGNFAYVQTAVGF